VLREVLEHRVLDLLGRVVPQADDLVEALALGHEAALGGLLDAGELALRVLEDLLLLLGDRHVLDADRDARGRGELEAVLLQAVEEGGGALDAEALEALDDEVAQGAPLVDGVVADQLGGDVAARGERLAHDAAEHGAAGAGLDELAVDADRDGVLHVDVALLHRHERLVDAAEAVLQATDARLPARDRDRRVEVELALGVGLERGLGAVVAVAGTLLADVQLREHVEAEDDVARGVHVRTAVRRREQVVAGEHLEPGLGLRVDRQRHVDRHLVAVEVGVERLAHERVELDRLALDEDRLERLDAEAVERGRAVEEHDLVGDDLLQGVPDLVLHVAGALELLAGALDVVRQAALLERLEEERLEQLEGHALGRAALVELELRADDDHRAAGVVDALPEQVLPEAALLAAQQVGERAVRPVGAGVVHRGAAAAVVDQGVDGLLEHALLVAHDHLGRALLHQLLQAVVAVDQAPVQVVEVGGSEAPALDLHHRAQGRWHDRHGLEDHPGRVVVGVAERLDDLEALAGLRALVARRRVHLLDELGLELLE